MFSILAIAGETSLTKLKPVFKMTEPEQEITTQRDSCYHGASSSFSSNLCTPTDEAPNSLKCSQTPVPHVSSALINNIPKKRRLVFTSSKVRFDHYIYYIKP